MKGFPYLIWTMVIGLFYGAHFHQVSEIPLAEIGQSGAEFIPHIQRRIAQHHLDSMGYGQLLHPADLLRGLDGHYGALLHLLSTLWLKAGHVLGLGGNGFAFVNHLNLIYLSLLLGAIWGLSRHLDLGISPLLLTLGMPGIFATTRQYYYDLPMVAFIFVSLYCFVQSQHLERRFWAILAGFAAGLALLFKWAAALYILPLWILVLFHIPIPRPSKGRAVNLLLAMGALCVTSGWVALKADGSFAFQTGLFQPQGHDMQGLFRPPLPWLKTYAQSLVFDGIGLPLFALLMAVGLTIPRALAWAHLKIALLVLGVPLLGLYLGVKGDNGRYVMPLLPLFALIFSPKRPILKRFLPPFFALMALGQLAWHDGYYSKGSPAERREMALSQEPWRAWWWIGGRLATPSPMAKHQRQVLSALELAGDASIGLLSLKKDIISPHAWAYYKMVYRPNHPGFIALSMPLNPTAPNGDSPTTIVLAHDAMNGAEASTSMDDLLHAGYEHHHMLPGLNHGQVDYFIRSAKQASPPEEYGVEDE